MKKILFIAAALFCVAPLAADEYNYLTVTCTNAEQSISLPTVQKITFAEGNAVVTSSDGQVYTYPLTELQKMTFTANPTAIKALPTQEKDLIYKGGILKVTGTGILRIYNSAGALLQMAHVRDAANINLGSLPKGIYVVSMGQQTIKVKK
ncbi:MAG: T9SS type A sorting domain-containing protein [Paraprevotella sp.]|nr:T9SS type A sorting domain-containing protein [Bacteroidaceae bacterium]MCI6743597.1 T9SS type A sorting domain-containing protein [Paraprevotella sp.]MCI7081288.1 T9SS type A sorting domain-containing protein [Paraprevotella sp.]MCI7143163.1 T9SS type A sorting domain-containing protein [Paraprevotella sp.]MDD6759300.1 T9SS type A sorting domain-containing protein [Paraprevotella sp.]